MRKGASNNPAAMRRPAQWTCVLGLAVVLSITTASQSLAQTIIYQEDFDGTGAPIHNTQVDVGGELWQAGDAFRDDGAVDTVIASSANGQAAWLPFAPTNGFIYTLTVDIENQHPDWIAVGFMPALPPNSDWTQTDWSVRHSNNGAHAWMLTRERADANNQEAFNGPNTSNNAFGGSAVPTDVPVTMKIVLDTRAPTWTAEYFLNGTSYGVFSLPATANTDIGGVGFSRDRNATAGTGGILDNFVLTEELAPLPGSWDGDVSNLWSVAANWVDDTLPDFFNFADSLNFTDVNGAGSTLINDIVGAELLAISFQAGAPSYTLTGNAVDLGTSITNFSSNGQEIAFDLATEGQLVFNANGGPITASGVLVGTNGLVKGGGSPLTLSNALNDFTGTVSFTGLGSIVLAASGALGDPASSIVLSSAAYAAPVATLELAGAAQQKVYTLNARVTSDPVHIRASSGVNTLTGTMTGDSGGNRYLIAADAGAVLNLDTDFSMLTASSSERLMRFDGDGTININGQLDDAAAGTALGLAKANGLDGRLNLIGMKNYTGSTLVDSGTVALVDPTSSNSIPNSSMIRPVSTNGVVDFTGLLGGGIVLASGQTLAGDDGIVLGSVTAADGSIIAPGFEGVGTIGLPALTMEGGSKLVIEISGDGADRLDITAGGTLVGPSSGIVAVNVEAVGAIAPGDYIIMDWSQAAVATGVDLSDFACGAGTLSIVGGNQLQLSISLTTLANVLVTDTDNDRVLNYSVTQFGAWVPDATLPVFAEGSYDGIDFLAPTAMAKDPAGNVYIAEGLLDQPDRIIKFAPDGTYLTTVADAFFGDFSGTPEALVVDPSGAYLYMSIAEPNSGSVDVNMDDVVYRIDLVGSASPQIYIPTTNVGGTYVLENPTGLAFGPDGKLYVGNNLAPEGTPDPGSRVLRFDVSGSTGAFDGVLTAEHRDIKDLFYDEAEDRLLVSMNALSDIWAYTDLTLDYVAEGDSSFEYVYNSDAEEVLPAVVAVAGNVFFSDATNNVIRRVTATDAAPNVVGAEGGLANPQDLLVLNQIDPFDFDGDGDVDLDDASVFVDLMTGPGNTVPPAAADPSDFTRADIDDDGDVDLIDYMAFSQRFTN